MKGGGKIPAEEKIKLVKQCINGKESISGIARKADVAEETIRAWVRQYETDGITTFQRGKNRQYTPEPLRCAWSDRRFQAVRT